MNHDNAQAALFEYLQTHPLGDEQSIITITKTVEVDDVENLDGLHEITMRLISENHMDGLHILQGMVGADKALQMAERLQTAHFEQTSTRLGFDDTSHSPWVFNEITALILEGQPARPVHIEITAPTLGIAMGMTQYFSSQESWITVLRSVARGEATVQL